MRRIGPAFCGYRIYRRKFLGIGVVVLLLSVTVFCGILIFFIHTWANALEQQVQQRFLEREQRLLEIQDGALDYVNRLYGDTKLMEDLDALFASQSEDCSRDSSVGCGKKDNPGAGLGCGFEL